MGRHAYCIIAHTDSYTLNSLLKCITDERNEIFILIDKKNRHTFPPPINHHVTISNHNIHWGDISLIKAELTILAKALEYGPFDYYHLLSGQDLPLHSQDFIHEFFAAQPLGTNYIGFADELNARICLIQRLKYYDPFTKYQRGYGVVMRKTIDILRKRIFYFQEKFGRLSKLPEIEFKKGCNWASLSEEFTKFLCERRTKIIKMFKGITCADEIYKQTIIWNSPFRNTLYNSEDEYIGCVRAIDWSRGNPYIWQFADRVELSESNAIFARKFNSSVDRQIIDYLCARISSMNSDIL